MLKNSKFIILITSILGALIIFKESQYGIPRVVDGDTLVIDNHKVRLYAIDAVEKHQTCKNKEGREWKCGLEAKDFLTKLVDNNKVLCIAVDKDKYKRLVGLCYNHNFQNINAEMVRRGYAVAYTRYSNIYINEEKQAKNEKLGIWSGKFTKPEKYRRNKKH